MSFFDLDPTATQNLMDQARLNPLDPETLKPGWFAGAWKAPVTGLASAWNDAALLLGDAGTPVLRSAARPIDELFGTTTATDWVNRQQQTAVDNIKDWAPDPRTTGVAGQVVHGLFNVIPEVIAGGPEVAGVLQGYRGFRGGMADGLDPGTAFGKGTIDGITAWAGLKMPMTVAPHLGLAGLVGTGAVANVGMGMASRGATGQLLEARGFPEMAKQYEILDQTAIATDLLMGGGFGAIAHYGPVGWAKYQEYKSDKNYKALLTDIDTALNLNNQLHVELDTAPGIPTDPAARAAHVEAIDSAIKSLLKGEDVNVGNEVTTQVYTENPTATQTRTEIVRVVEDHMGPEWQGLQGELEARGLPTDTNLYQVTRTQPGDMAPVRPTAEVKGIIDRAQKEGWDTARIIDELEAFKGKLEARNEAQLEARSGDRVRGELWMRERLTRAERNGELSPEAVRLANWLIDKNPNIVGDLAISFSKAGKGDVAGEAGGYNPLERIVNLVKGRANDETVAHEILHHAERMMPEDVQAGVRQAWFKELRAVTEMAKRTQNHTLMQAAADALHGANGDQAAFKRLAEMISKGEIDESFYGLANPSEFWAVNGSRIIRERAAEGWVAQAKQWMTEFIEKIKDAFGLKSDAAVIRGLDNVLNGDGRFANDNMLADGRVPRMRDVGSNFKRWFGDSKVVDADGQPRVVYHGSPDARFVDEDGVFATMKDRMLKFGATPESRSSADVGRAFFFTTSESVAKTYANPSRAFDYQAADPSVIPVFLRISNPLEFDAKGVHWREAQKQISKDDFIAKAKLAGHDGVVIKNVRDSYDSMKTGRDPKSDVFVAFESNQIKSATRNSGDFDPANPSILRQITKEQAKDTNVEVKMPSNPLFNEAVANTPGATLDADGLTINLVRFQKPEQEGAQAIRTGVFYLPAGSASAKHYKGGKIGYGGSEKFEGETLLRRPLFVKGATGGKAPEAAYDAVMGKGEMKKLDSEVMSVISERGWMKKMEAGLFEERVANFLKDHNADPGMANEIIRNSTQGNTLRYALQENVIAHAVREAGFDSVVGYSKVKEGARISEVFDVREQTFPSDVLTSEVHKKFNGDPYGPEAILADNPNMNIINDNGQSLPAHEALAQSDAEIATAKQDAQGFDAAVACALRG